MIEKQKSRLEPKFKLAEDFLNLKTLNTNVIIEQLEESMKVREMPIELQVKKRLKF